MSKPQRGKRVTIRDVAQLAGVSTASVSNVLNEAPGVSERIRVAVLDAVEKLNYRPNYAARSLRARRSHTIGIVTDDLEGVFTISLVRGVEETSSEEGFSVFLCNSYGEAARERTALEMLLAKQVDGVILMSGYRVRERTGPAVSLAALPLLYLYQYTRELEVPSVVPDDQEGGALGARHLIELGHRRIGLINGPSHYEATQLRLDGYRQALSEAGLSFDPSLVRVGRWRQTAGYRLTHELMALAEPPTAILCMSDILAFGAVDALRELGLRIPEDVSLVGFDNRILAGQQRPPLTTVALPLYEMGKLAGQLLIATIQGKEPRAEVHRVPCYLVERDSCSRL